MPKVISHGTAYLYLRVDCVLGIYDEIILDEEIRSILGKYAGSGVFQTKYMGENGYIEVYDTGTIRRICCPINIHVKLLVKPKSKNILYRDPLFDRIPLSKIGRTHAVEVTGWSRFPAYDIEALKDVLEHGRFSESGSEEREHYKTYRTTIARIPFHNDMIKVTLKKITLDDLSIPVEEEGEQDTYLSSLLAKASRRRVYIHAGEIGVAVPRDTCLNIGFHEIEVKLEKSEVDKETYTVYTRKLSIEGCGSAKLNVKASVVPGEQGEINLYMRCSPRQGLEESISRGIGELEETLTSILTYKPGGDD